MNLKKTLIFCFVVGFLSSCKWMAECYPEFTGQVLSNTTKTPLEGATVTLINQNISVQTDENGFFKMSASGCFDAHFKISKANYKPFEITLSSSSNSNSYQVRSESKSVDYNEPIRSKDSSVVTGSWIDQNSKSFFASPNGVIYYLDTLKKVSDEIIDIQSEYKARDSIN